MAQDIRIMVPRVRRAVEGVGAEAVLTDDQMKDLVADAIASVILYSGSAFGNTLTVTATESDIPTEYAIDPELSLPEQVVIATQAALDFFFFKFAGVKVQERIGDEAQSWEYTLSANLLRDQLKLLKEQRDAALEALSSTESLVAYESFLAVRDLETARLVEPFTFGLPGIGGQEIDYRFSAA